MKDDKRYSEANEYRMKLGYKLLMELAKNEDLPMPNVNRLSKTMQEYYKTLGFEDDIADNAYTWRPDVDYWKYKMRDICEYMRYKHNKFFGYVYQPGRKCTDGVWKFMNKKECDSYLRIDHANIATRSENHNDKIDSSPEKFNISLPRIKVTELLN